MAESYQHAQESRHVTLVSPRRYHGTSRIAAAAPHRCFRYKFTTIVRQSVGTRRRFSFQRRGKTVVVTSRRQSNGPVSARFAARQPGRIIVEVIGDPRGLYIEPSRAFGALSGVVDRPCFPDNRDLDLTRVLQALFDLLDDVPREPARRQVVDLRGRNEDADLAPGLDGE